jgi:acetyltransferase
VDLQLRDIRPDDKPALRDLRSRLSPETVYRRYHGHKGELTNSELRYFTEVDGHEHVALVAEDPAQPGEILGIARAVVDGEREAEVAIVVRDDLQGEGVGQTLIESLLVRMGHEGVHTLRAEVQADNHRAVHFFQGLGARQRSGSGSALTLVLRTRVHS